MNLEKNTNSRGEPKLTPVLREVDNRRPDVTKYIFPHVVIGINRSGRNVKDVPELLFGTYTYDESQARMDQPEFKIPGVDMEYIIKCIEMVIEQTGDTQFWFDPYTEDARSESGGTIPSDEEKQRRALVRARLFAKHFDLEPGPDGWGYIIKR